MSRQTPPPVVDGVLLFARVAVGIIFFAHGWNHLFTTGIEGTQHEFKSLGAPAPSFSAWYAGIVELIGGVLLIIGVLIPLAAVLLFLDMAGAFFFVHWRKGIYVSNGGYELVLALGAAALALGAVGPGRYSIAGLLGHLRGGRRG